MAREHTALGGQACEGFRTEEDVQVSLPRLLYTRLSLLVCSPSKRPSCFVQPDAGRDGDTKERGLNKGEQPAERGVRLRGLRGFHASP
eukprot:6482721-Amphidinium_carterae.1